MLSAGSVTLLLLQSAVVVLCGVCLIPEPISRQGGQLNRTLVQRSIVDSRAVNIEQVPYQISLLQDGQFLCGGVLISKDWALTAANCVLSRDAESLLIRMGSSEYWTNGQLVGVERVVAHEMYIAAFHDYDVALLKLNESVVFDDSKRAVKLPEEDQSFKDCDLCRVSGWGNAANPQHPLREVQTALVNLEECRESRNLISDSTICAADVKAGSGACYGNSGSALVNTDGLLLGLASWANGCPAVYTRITKVRKWIKEYSDI